MPSPFTWNPNVPAPTDLLKIFPTTPQYVGDKTTLETILGTLAPTALAGTPTVGFRLFQDGNQILHTINCKTINGSSWAYTQDDATYPSILWYATSQAPFGVAFGPAGSTAFSWYTLVLDASGNVTLNAGLSCSGTVTFGGTVYHHGSTYFGASNQSYFDGSGNLLVQQAVTNGPAYHRGSGTYFGASDQASFDNAGNLNAVTINCATFYNNPTFTGSVQINGNDTSAGTAFHHGVAYFGASNQSYFDTNGYLSAASGGTLAGSFVNSGTCYHQGVAYFGSGNTSYFNTNGTAVVAGNGINYVAAGDGAYHFLKWASGPFWQAFVNGSIVYSATPNYCDERVKRDIKPVEIDALEALRKIDLVSFTLVPEVSPEYTRHYDIGFTAQRTRNAIPDAIIDSEGMPFLDTTPIVAYLVRAVQQLAELVEAINDKLSGS